MLPKLATQAEMPPSLSLHHILCIKVRNRLQVLFQVQALDTVQSDLIQDMRIVETGKLHTFIVRLMTSHVIHGFRITYLIPAYACVPPRGRGPPARRLLAGLASPRPRGHRQGGQGPDPPDAGAAAAAQHMDHAPQG